ncbi:MAG: hypothetical protein H8E28_13670 [Anaerolineae bacterium]|nr:hypothetical protein [Anaerolineae bacterium]
MKKQPVQQILLLGLALTIGIFALAMPDEDVLAETGVDQYPYITFTIINQSQFDFSLLLYGPNSYDITVPPYSEVNYILDRGWYAFTMGSCNLSEVGTFDFTNDKTIHVPVCGGTAGEVDRSSQHIDSSDYIRPATIKIRNQTRQNVDVYLRTLEEHHFMQFGPKEVQLLLIEDASQTFVYSYTACGKLYTGYTRLFVHVPFDIKCDS